MFQVVFRLAQILVLALMLVLPASGVLAQGFMVKPMRMEVSGQAGQNLEIPLQIRNTAGNSVGRVDVRLAGVSQHANGAWKLIEPETAESDDVGLSALPWMSLSENSVEIAPMTPAEISVLVNIPRNARGAYFAALIVETPLPEDEEGFNVRVRFLVPVIIRIEGRPVRQDVGIAAADLVFQDGSAGGPRTTLAEMWATNEGRTYSRVSGSIALDLEVEGRWRPVTRFDTVERSIIPGASINLGKDIERRLPSGSYRLRAELYVDGRRVAPLERVFDFVGDEDVDSIAYDTALLLRPEVLAIEGVPGATRTTILSIENASTDPVEIAIGPQTPVSLLGVTLAETTGVAFAATDWVEVRPSTFRLRPEGRQNVRIVSRIPEEGVSRANYYTDLVLTGRYGDGQSAGETRSLVHVANARAQSAAAGNIERLGISEADAPETFIVDTRFANTGDVHVRPKARAALISQSGMQVANVPLDGRRGPLLPVSVRDFSGEVDVSEIRPGFYTLRAIITVDGLEPMTRDSAVEISTGKDGAARMALVEVVAQGEAGAD